MYSSPYTTAHHILELPGQYMSASVVPLLYQLCADTVFHGVIHTSLFTSLTTSPWTSEYGWAGCSLLKGTWPRNTRQCSTHWMGSSSTGLCLPGRASGWQKGLQQPWQWILNIYPKFISVLYLFWILNFYSPYPKYFPFCCYYGLNCVPLKFICWSPNSQYLRMWLCL